MNNSREQACSFPWRSNNAQAPGTLRCAELGQAGAFEYITWCHFKKAENYGKYYHFHFTGEEMSWES